MRDNEKEKFYNILCTFAYGLRKKLERCGCSNQIFAAAGINEYIKNEQIMRAMAQLSIFALQHKLVDLEGIPLAPQDENDAIERYLSQPVAEWVEQQWGMTWAECLDVGSLEEALIQVFPGNQYEMTALGAEMAMQYEYDREWEESRAYQLLRGLQTQEAYVFCRRFIIEHPIVSNLELIHWMKALQQLKISSEGIETMKKNLYESIPEDSCGICGYCGWTLSRRSNGRIYCINPRCREATEDFRTIFSLEDLPQKLRLIPGVMRYIALPGILEIQLAKLCEKHGISYELWPEFDSYDIKIVLPHKEILIDAKDWCSPFALRADIENRGVFQHVDMKHKIAYVVVPDSIKKSGRDYCKIVEKGLERIHVYGVKCISLSDLGKRLKEVLKNG